MSFIEAVNLTASVNISDTKNYTSYPTASSTNSTILVNSLINSLALQTSGNGDLITKAIPQTITANHTFSGDVSFSGGISGVSKEDVGLGNVDNTSDTNKPVSTATTTQLNLKANLTANTFTGLQTHNQYPVISSYGSGPTTTLQLAPKKYIDDNFVSKSSNNTLTGVQNFNNNVIIGDGIGGDVVTINANISANSQTITPAQLSRINKYDVNTNLSTLLNAKANLSSNYFSGPQYFNTDEFIIGDGVNGNIFTIKGNIQAGSNLISTFELGRVKLYDSEVQLSNLLNQKADRAGDNVFQYVQNFENAIITVKTQPVNDSSKAPASTEFCSRAIANLVASAPENLNVLSELASAINNDASFSSTMTNLIATKSGLTSSNTFTNNNTFNSDVVLGSDNTKLLTINSNIRANSQTITPTQLSRINRYNIDTNLDTLLNAKANLASDNTYTANQIYNSVSLTPAQMSKIQFCDVSSSLTSLLTNKANTSQIIYANNWIVNAGINTLSSVISSIGSSQAQNVQLSAGAHSDTANPLIVSTININITGPPSALSGNITQYNAGVTIQGSSCYNVRFSNIQFTQPIIVNGTQGKHYFTNTTFNNNFTLLGSTTNWIIFYYCQFAGVVTIPNTFAGYIIFYFCDFQGATLTFNNASNQQLIINSCVNLPSLSLNASLLGFNNTSSSSSISTNSLNVLGTTTFPNNSINSTAINNSSFVDLSSNQSIAGIKTLSSYPAISSYGSGPTTLQFAPRKYIDDNFVSKTSNNTLTGIQNFNNNLIIGDNVGNDTMTINANIIANGTTITPAQLAQAISRYNVDTNLDTLLSSKANLAGQNNFTGINVFQDLVSMRDIVMPTTGSTPSTIQFYDGTAPVNRVLGMIRMTATDETLSVANKQDTVVATINKNGTPTATTDVITKSYIDRSLFIVGDSAKTVALLPFGTGYGIVYLNFTDSMKIIQLVTVEVVFITHNSSANSLTTNSSNKGVFLYGTYNIIYSKANGSWIGTPTLLNGNASIFQPGNTRSPILFGTTNGRPAITYCLMPSGTTNSTTNTASWISAYNVSIRLISSIHNSATTSLGDTGNCYFSLT